VLRLVLWWLYDVVRVPSPLQSFLLDPLEPS
jgi:hypothetical protein